MHTRFNSILLALACATALSASGLTSTAHAHAASTDLNGLETAQRLSDAFAHVADMIHPSIVSIQNSRTVERRPSGISPFYFGSPFEDMLPDQFRRSPDGDQPRSREYLQQSQGSGVIISEDGYILTNNHVVEEADEIMVTLHDKREFVANVVGTDPQTDVAVLQIEASGLTPATLGRSQDLRIGQWVVAAGNPFGLSSTITAGIVSATGRNVGIFDQNGYEYFIQTDAAINPGNSGGPLVDLRGHVIGINTAIYSRSGGNVGIGFAIPIDLARDVMDELITDGKVVRGYLGVLIQDLTTQLADSFEFDGSQGALIAHVEKDSPADEGGLEVGDIVTEFEGTGVVDSAQLKLLVANVDPGEKAQVKVFRDGTYTSLTIKLGERESSVASSNVSGEMDDGLGMSLQTLTSETARQLGVSQDTEGVLVTRVRPLTPAARAGLQPQDIIESVRGTPVKSVRDFERALKKTDLKKGVRLRVTNPRGGTRFVVLKSDD